MSVRETTEQSMGELLVEAIQRGSKIAPQINTGDLGPNSYVKLRNSPHYLGPRFGAIALRTTI
jgi:hypothetical protein